MTRDDDLPLEMKLLIVDDELNSTTSGGRAVRALVDELQKAGVSVIESNSADDGKTVIRSDPSVQCVLMDWCLDDGDPMNHENAIELLKLIRSRNIHMPIFLMADRNNAPQISAHVMSQVDELIMVLEDTPAFIAGRVLASMQRYREQIEPPFN
jgi:arginine decarboxylase